MPSSRAMRSAVARLSPVSITTPTPSPRRGAPVPRTDDDGPPLPSHPVAFVSQTVEADAPPPQHPRVPHGHAMTIDHAPRAMPGNVLKFGRRGGGRPRLLRAANNRLG